MSILDFTFTPIVAYLDPGTGSLILQLVVGSILGLLILFRGWFGALLGMMGGKKAQDLDDDIDDVEE